MLPIADIDAKRPTAITILGKQLVVWKDSAGDCHVFADRCPHRLVALSEGRIEGDELMCAYHGWRFDGAVRSRILDWSHSIAVFSESSKAACLHRRQGLATVCCVR